MRKRDRKASRLLEMPVDIMLTVLSLLHPDDLLRLLVVARALRNFLLLPSSIVIWKGAEKFCGLPDCPDDLTHLKYARLVFGNVCTLCKKGSRTVKLFFVFRARLCKKCLSENVQFAWRIPFYMYQSSTDRADVLWLDPAVSVSMCASTRRYVIKWDLVPSIGLRGGHQGNCCAFYVRSLRAAFEKYSSLSGSDKREFASKRREEVVKIKEHALLFERWENDRLQVRKLEDERMKAAFRSEVYKKLQESGYIDSDLDISTRDFDLSRKWKALLETPKKLTAREWQLLYPKLQGIIQQKKERALQFAIKKRRAQLAQMAKDIMASSPELFVTTDDLASSEHAKPILENTDHNVSFAPADLALLDLEVITTIKPPLLRFVDRCARLLIESRLNAGYALSDIPDRSVLRWRSAFFLFRSSGQEGLETKDFDMLLKGVANELEQYEIPVFYDRVYVPPFSLIQALLESVYLPGTTHADMDRYGDNFACLRCGRSSLTWFALVSHFIRENQLLSVAYGPNRSLLLASVAGNAHYWDMRRGRIARYDGQIHHAQNAHQYW